MLRSSCSTSAFSSSPAWIRKRWPRTLRARRTRELITMSASAPRPDSHSPPGPPCGSKDSAIRIGLPGRALGLLQLVAEPRGELVVLVLHRGLELAPQRDELPLVCAAGGGRAAGRL